MGGVAGGGTGANGVLLGAVARSATDLVMQQGVGVIPSAVAELPPILSVQDVMSYCHKLVRGYGKNACWLTCPPPPPSHKGHPDEAGAPSSAYLTPGGAASNSSLSTLPFSTDARLPLACKRCLLQMRAVATAAMAHSKTDATLTTEGTEGTEGTAVWSEATDTPSLMMAPPPPLPQPLVAGTAPATHSGGRRKTWALTAQAVASGKLKTSTAVGGQQDPPEAIFSSSSSLGKVPSVGGVSLTDRSSQAGSLGAPLSS